MKMLEGRQMLGKHGLLRSTSKKSNCRCSTSSAQVSHGLVGQHLGALTSLDSQGDRASAVQGKETEEHSNRRADGGRWQRDPRAGLQERPGCSAMQGVGVEGIGFPEDRVLGPTSQGGRRNGLGIESGTTGRSHQGLCPGWGEWSEAAGTSVVPEGKVLYHYSVFILPLPSFISVSGRAEIRTWICVSLRLMLFIHSLAKKQKVGHHGERTKVAGEDRYQRSSGRTRHGPKLGGRSAACWLKMVL